MFVLHARDLMVFEDIEEDSYLLEALLVAVI